MRKLEGRRTMPKEHDIVALNRDVPEAGLRLDDIGTAVCRYVDGDYEVKFTGSDGPHDSRGDCGRGRSATVDDAVEAFATT